jgi:hypothetical protein
LHTQFHSTTMEVDVTWRTPKLFDRLNYKSKCENIGRIMSCSTLLGLQHFRGRRACWNLGRGLGRATSGSIIHTTCTNHTTSWLMCSWNTFDALTSHEQTWSHNTHHNLDMGETTTFPLILFSVLGHGTCTQMSFCLGTPKLGVSKFLKLGLLQLWRLIISCAYIQLRWYSSKIIALIKMFSMVCDTPPTHK